MEENPYTSPAVPSLPSPPPLPPFEKKAWNGWWTLLWFVILFILWQIVMTIGVVTGLVLDGVIFRNGGNFREIAKSLELIAFDGDIIGASAFASIFVVCPVCWILGKVRPGWTGWEYLGKARVRWWQWPLWAVVTVGFGMLFGLMAPSLGVEGPDDSMIQMAQTTNFPILLFLGVAIGAPMVEEFMFRGVLFRGWRESRMGLWPAILLTSLLWTLLHAQYFETPIIIGYLFIFGIILGFAREWTGSLWVPIWMHFVNNALAFQEMIGLAE